MSDPRWLNRDEQMAWLALTKVMLKLPFAIESQLQRDNGLTLFEYFVLSSLSMAPERTMQMTSLATITNGSPSRLSNVVKRLEQRGLMRRSIAPENGRCTNATLTDEGYAVVEKAAPGHVEAVRHLVFDTLEPEQVGQLRDIGNRIGTRVDPQQTWPG